MMLGEFPCCAGGAWREDDALHPIVLLTRRSSLERLGLENTAKARPNAGRPNSSSPLTPRFDLVERL